MVLDSLSEIRLLAQSSLRYRRQVLALKHYFSRNDATVLLLDDLTTETLDKTVHSVAHGVIRLEETAPDYGAERRRMRVIKYRGQRFRGGHHDMVIETGGVKVFPRLVSGEHHTEFKRETVSSNSPALDRLLGGGHRARLEHAGPRPGRDRQVAAHHDVRGAGGRARREGRLVHLRRGTRACCSNAPRASASTSRRCRTAAIC